MKESIKAFATMVVALGVIITIIIQILVYPIPTDNELFNQLLVKITLINSVLIFFMFLFVHMTFQKKDGD